VLKGGEMIRVVLTVAMLFGLCLVMGCSTAGPFVTDIYPDGQGGLIVERDKIRYDGFFGRIENVGNPTTHIIKVK
jgi:hypothetical protein